MPIEKTTNLSFQGGFYIKNTNNVIKSKVNSLIPKTKRQIFHNLKEEGDMFIITHDSDNYKIANFIKSNKINIDYYPKINTTNYYKQPEEIVELMQQQKNSIIKNPDLIKSPLKSSISLTRAINTVSKTLRLNIENPQITRNDKVLTTIRDNAKERNINIILTKGNSYYVEVSPDSPRIDKTFAIINSNGRFPKICKDLDDRLNFMKTFKSLQEENANTLYKYKLQ